MNNENINSVATIDDTNVPISKTSVALTVVATIGAAAIVIRWADQVRLNRKFKKAQKED
jgi:hypothetical protein